MEVVKTSSDILCNSEVLQFLREEREKNLQKKSQFRKDNKGGQAATVVLETLTYLDKSPSAIPFMTKTAKEVFCMFWIESCSLQPLVILYKRWSLILNKDLQL